MSRFDNDGDENFPGQWGLWESALKRTTNGKKGQAALRDLRQALLDLPDKKLISGRLADEQGSVCTVGALYLHREVAKGSDRAEVLASLAAEIEWNEEDGVLDPYDAEQQTIDVGRAAGLTLTLAVHLAEEQDWDYRATDEERYEKMLRHVNRLIVEADPHEMQVASS